MSMVNVLAGDVGGTTTRLGLFETTAARPRPVAVREFTTLGFSDLHVMITAFLASLPPTDRVIARACFGVAGAVADGAASLTNIRWPRIHARELAHAFELQSVQLLNDLEAMAHALRVLEDSELHVLQAGRPDAHGGSNIAVLAAGTGLGEAFVHRVGGRDVVVASEAGHADFAARTERDIAVLRHLVARYGRAQVEDVISGRGLLDIHIVMHGGDAGRCLAAIDPAAAGASAAITAAALGGRCPACADTLSLFVEAYGAEAGNLALRTVATGGIFVGGGIATKILPALTDGRFIGAFRAKAPFDTLLDGVPVKVILNTDAGLLGAANFCSHT
jgi:glucokinase